MSRVSAYAAALRSSPRSFARFIGEPLERRRELGLRHREQVACEGAGVLVRERLTRRERRRIRQRARAALRDLLLRIAMTGLVRARWSERILYECLRSIAKNQPHIPGASLERTRYAVIARLEEKVSARNPVDHLRELDAEHAGAMDGLATRRRTWVRKHRTDVERALAAADARPCRRARPTSCR